MEEHNKSCKNIRYVSNCIGGANLASYKNNGAFNEMELLDEYDDECEFEDTLAAMQSTTPRDPLPCISKVLHGNCSKDNCAYAHQNDAISKARTQWMELIKKQVESTNKSVSLLRRPDKISVIETETQEDPPDNVVDIFSAIRNDLFLANMPSNWYVRSIHREGRIILDQGIVTVPNALFDSGALTASYISEAFVEKHIEQLQPYMQDAKGTVRLAADEHTVQIKRRLLLEVTFEDADGKQHSARVCFYVLPGSNNDMVIGFPAIVGQFSTVFLGMIKTAVEEYGDVPSHELCYVTDDTQHPWSTPQEEDAPEEVHTPEPCSFTGALHFMEMSVEEAKQEYFSQIEEHVSPEFRAATKVVELLKTKGVLAFIPSNWEGIKHIKPLELKLIVQPPSRMKPPTRYISSRILPDAKNEFDRLVQYFYAPSNSPHASPLVIAPKATKPFIRFCGDYVAINKYIAAGHYPIPHVQHSLEKICGFKIFMDIDLVNAFHQVPLAKATSELLSVQIPWG